MSIPKLSDAILLSIGIVRERRDLYLIDDDNNDPCGCAIGTALYSVGIRGYADLSLLFSFWPWTRHASPSGMGWTIAREISQLHYEGATREAIAAWVATIEPQEDIANATTTVLTEVVSR